MGRKWLILVAAAMMVLGLGVLLYPTVSSTINRLNGSYTIQEFQQHMDTMDAQEKEAELAAAIQYNEMINMADKNMDENETAYYSILDFGNGIMGYIHIPGIDVKLPIYHGVSTQVLEKGVGHLPTSSFPIRGEGNHAVLTGHTGLPSASLFTDLHKMQEGDQFQVTVGDTVMTYQVDQIKVVLPNETEDLQAVPGEDYCTLVTCTPYGVNSHRLLVRGSRIEITEQIPEERELTNTDESSQHWLYSLLLIPAVGAIILCKRKRGKI